MPDDVRDPHRYQPSIDPAYWEAIRDFVRDVVARTETTVPYTTYALYRASTEFTLWAWQTAGLPLEVEDLFERSVIAFYVQTGCGQLTAAARGNRRSLLLRMSEHLLLDAPTRLEPMPASNPSEPYSRREIVSIVSWARAQSTPERRANAHALVALGLGGGLSSQEIIALQVKDVHRERDQVTVTVAGTRRRDVPLLDEYAELMPAVNIATPNGFVFRPGRTQIYVNAISNFVKRGNGGGLRPTTQRMRATWLVHHLNAGTPLTVLTRAAGLESLDALARFEHFATEIDAATATRLLRSARHTPTLAE